MWLGRLAAAATSATNPQEVVGLASGLTSHLPKLDKAADESDGEEILASVLELGAEQQQAILGLRAEFHCHSKLFVAVSKHRQPQVSCSSELGKSDVNR